MFTFNFDRFTLDATTGRVVLVIERRVEDRLDLARLHCRHCHGRLQNWGRGSAWPHTSTAT